MKILVVSQYFYPENFRVNDLCLGLKEKGHEVFVLTGIPNYPEGKFFSGFNFWKNNDSSWNDIKVYRCKLFPRGNNYFFLMLNYVSFPFFASIRCLFLKEKFDKIIIYGMSPVTMGLPAIIVKWKQKIPYFFWVQDLWPESLRAASGLNNKYILGFFDKITKLIYKHSQKVLVQSKGFTNYIINQGVPEDKIIFYPNSTESFYKVEVPQKKYLDQLPKGFNLLFAGNLGEAQSLITLIEAAEILKDKALPINWIFIGEGRYRAQLEFEIENRKLNNVYWLGSFLPTEMPFFFSCVDGLIVSLKKSEIFSLTIPSKVQSYLACEKPILASLDGEGGNIITQANCGFVSPAEDKISLAENVMKLFNLSKEEREQMGKNGGIYYKQEFEREYLLNKLIKIFENN